MSLQSLWHLVSNHKYPLDRVDTIIAIIIGVMRMAKRKAIVKRLPTVEALGCVDFICSDKTGTLTTNDMTVYCDRTSHDILREMVTPTPTHNVKSNREDDGHNKALMEIAVLCNNAQLDEIGQVSGSSSTERALLKYAKHRILDNVMDQHDRLAEVPFSSDRKFMSVQCRSKNNPSAVINYVKGAIEEILPRCKYFLACGRQHPFETQCQFVVEQAAHTLALRGLRVIAFARGRTLVDLEFVGLIGLHDPPRPGVDESIRQLQMSGVRVSMITGDAKETATSIAAMLGMQSEGHILLSGAEVDGMSDVDLQRVADKV